MLLVQRKKIWQVAAYVGDVMFESPAAVVQRALFAPEAVTHDVQVGLAAVADRLRRSIIRRCPQVHQDEQQHHREIEFGHHNSACLE